MSSGSAGSSQVAAITPDTSWLGSLKSAARSTVAWTKSAAATAAGWAKSAWTATGDGVRKLADAMKNTLTPRIEAGTRTIAMAITSDGTPTFDADDNPGNDSSEHNGIVRVNDLVQYRLDYGVSGVESKNTTIKMDLPKGMILDKLPAFCGDGSSLTPSVVPSPTPPYTANSINELPEQMLSCNIGTKVGAAESFTLSVRVSNAVHNGTVLAPKSVTLKGDGLSDVAAPSIPSVKATSALKWNISKMGLSGNGKINWSPAAVACPGNNAKTCLVQYFPLLISARADGKGSMPAVGDVTFTDDVSPRKLFPGLTDTQYTQMESDPGKYGVILKTSGNLSNMPRSSLGPCNDTQFTPESCSVRDSGQLTLVQAGPGQPGYLTLKNTDWSLNTYPTKSWGNYGNPVAGYGYAVSLTVVTYVPVDTVKDFGIYLNEWNLHETNTYTDLLMHGYTAADVETSIDQDIHDDSNTVVNTIALRGSFSSFFFGVTGVPENESRDLYTSQYVGWSSARGEGLPGNHTKVFDGQSWVGTDQEVLSQMAFTGSSELVPLKETHLGCTAWDNTKLNLTGLETGTVADTYNAIPSNKRPVWLSGMWKNGKYISTENDAPPIEIEYAGGSVPASGADASCSQAGVTWYDAPEKVPGNSVQGMALSHPIYTAVNRVRVRIVLPEVANATVEIGLTSGKTLAKGTILPMWAADIWQDGELTKNEILISDKKKVIQSLYDPDKHEGSPGDRLTIALAQLGVTSGVRKGSSGTFVSDVAATGNEKLQFQLQASLSGGSVLISHKVWLEDCLPAALEYVPPDGLGGGSKPAPAVISASTPSDAKRPACAPGETYIRWEINGQKSNQTVPEIILEARVSKAAANGTYTNSVVAWTDAGDTDLASRKSTVSVSVDNIIGIAIDKRNLTATVEVNRIGNAQIESNIWELSLQNTQPSTGGLTAPEIVDVLPVTGQAGSSFSGTAKLKSVTVTAGDVAGNPVVVEYTKASNVPRDTATPMPATVKWCKQADLGSAGCPATVAESTAVRLSRPGVFASGESITAKIAVDVVGDKAGDTISNEGYARITGLRDPVGPVYRAQQVVSSSLSGLAWWDLDGAGVRDASEPVVKGLPVKLSGTDNLGNPVNLMASTDAAGKYAFTGLRSAQGAYTVTFDKGESVGFTKQTQGADRSKDSDVDANGVVAVPLPADTVSGSAADAGLLAGVVAWKKSTGPTSDGVKPLSGSEWRITDSAGAPVADVSGSSLNLVQDCNTAGGVCQANLIDVDAANAAFKVIGLPAGSYLLKETKAPAGYVLSTQTYPFTIDASHTSVDLGEIVNVQHEVPGLPLTGGISVFSYLLLGLGLLLVGSLLGVGRSRRLLDGLVRGRHRG
ncbi:hypothetical protein KIM372_15150 [Bombiscardovia nodaiensis]|uniref:Collagen-binding protein n=1 Tax=Bombiscardovia nodaiensis TaxID=2932181 RepID=A0ABM8B9W9_9BIFI|nr:hypothetical protein KIM372_15150 [Bombiscardovia nodaiensis]